MDPYLHTAIVLLVIAVSYYIGKRSGRLTGITSTIEYFIHYDIITEEDISKANERFENDRRGL